MAWCQCTQTHTILWFSSYIYIFFFKRNAQVYGGHCSLFSDDGGMCGARVEKFNAHLLLLVLLFDGCGNSLFIIRIIAITNDYYYYFDFDLDVTNECVIN